MFQKIFILQFYNQNYKQDITTADINSEGNFHIMKRNHRKPS